MSESFSAVECSIETLDRALYASREVGDLVDTGDYLLNTALYYAFGFVAGKYMNLSNNPTHLEDTNAIYQDFYITPARLESSHEYLRRIFGLQVTRKAHTVSHIGGHSTSYWNARPHQYAVKNWRADDKENPSRKYNIPKFGRERVLDQQHLFTAYLLPYKVEASSLASRIPRYVRIGKKKSKARVLTRVIEGKIEEGEFISNHPFGIYDYEGTPKGDLISIRMKPTPLIVQGRYDGKYICIPRRYENGKTILPYKLEFLKGKR